jgi:hypothetical protein
MDVSVIYSVIIISYVAVWVLCHMSCSLIERSFHLNTSLSYLHEQGD